MHINIIFQRPSYPFLAGGTQWSLHSLLVLLEKNNYAIELHNTGDKLFPPYRLNEAIKILEKFDIDYNINKNFLELNLPYKVFFYENFSINKFLSSCRENKGIIFIESPIKLKICDEINKLNLPIILFIRNTGRWNIPTLNRISNNDNKKIGIVFNSKSTASHYNKYLKKGISNCVFYPPIIPEWYFVKKYTPKYITIINPVINKGGLLISKIIELLPKDKFLIVEGWYDPNKEGLNFLKFPNVKYMKSTGDIREVYSVTKLLLVPSQWKEGFGRIASEATFAGVPVLASYQGGLIEALGPNGNFVYNYTSTSSWVQGIEKVLSKNKTISPQLKIYNEQFNAHKTVKKIIKFIKLVNV